MFYKILLSIFSLILALIIIEISFAVLDIYNPRPPKHVGEYKNKKSKYFVMDKHVGWRMAPNTNFQWITENRSVKYHSNEKGFRVSKNHKNIDKYHRKKILILGDSHLWGLGLKYDKSFAGLLNRSFYNLDVINLAMPGFGLDQIYLSLVQWGLVENPEMVIAGIFTDDFFRSFNAYKSVNKPVFMVVNGQLIFKSSSDKPNTLVRYLEKKSRILEFYRDGDEWLGRIFGIGEWWNMNKLILDNLIETCNKNDLPLLVVHIPYYTGNPFPELKRYLLAKNIDYIDLNDVAKGKLENLYFREDKHLNENGHRLLAKSVNQWIQDNIDKNN